MAEQDDKAPETAPAKEAEKKPPAKPVTYSNHAIHLVRTVQNNTLSLSQMADNKASILMGATFLVFSISVSRSLTGELPVSLAILAVFAFLSSLCAVMAVLPSTKSIELPEDKRNELFFGQFHELDEEEWKTRVLAQMETDEKTFRAMLRDIYQNGQVLQNKKYKYLGYAYRIFITGLVVTVIVFGIEMSQQYWG
ncbi:Pycsar system effector family protein [Erythrobacter sp. HKB08]|uniref:Pycsar system effector family protein n=1 Tax=Erythrobacter sp. HKB08 TaxID=2502843 RepID=UPI001F34968F|nr:Pycsar system effector family protein [Erythrobacter sp. HKB08]